MPNISVRPTAVHRTDYRQQTSFWRNGFFIFLLWLSCVNFRFDFFFTDDVTRNVGQIDYVQYFRKWMNEHNNKMKTKTEVRNFDVPIAKILKRLDKYSSYFLCLIIRKQNYGDYFIIFSSQGDMQAYVPGPRSRQIIVCQATCVTIPHYVWVFDSFMTLSSQKLHLIWLSG